MGPCTRGRLVWDGLTKRPQTCRRLVGDGITSYVFRHFSIPYSFTSIERGRVVVFRVEGTVSGDWSCTLGPATSFTLPPRTSIHQSKGSTTGVSELGSWSGRVESRGLTCRSFGRDVDSVKKGSDSKTREEEYCRGCLYPECVGFQG